MYLQAAGRSKTQIWLNRKFKGHVNWVEGIIHLPGGQRIITCSSDGTLRGWDLQSGKQIGNGWGDEASVVSSIALSPDGKKIASGNWDGAVELWNIDTGKAIAKWMGHTGNVKSVCWNRDGGRVVGGCSNGSARVWNVESGKTVLAIETGLGYLDAIIYSPDSTRIATGGESRENRFLKIFDAKTGKLVKILKGHTGRVYCLAWTADGTTLISGSYDRSIRIWNTTTWQQIAVLTGHNHFVYGIAISPNGRILASASLDKTVRLWNLDNRQPIGQPLQHAQPVDCASFSTDGKLLTTGCWDRNAYSWDISVLVREANLNDLLLPNDGNESVFNVRNTLADSSGLAEPPLNTDDDDKSFLDADATPCPDQQLEDANGLPLGFFDISESSTPHPSGRRHLLPFIARLHHVSVHISAHGRALLGRVSSLSRRTCDRLHGTLPQPRRPGWPRNPFNGMLRTRNDEHIESQKRRPVVVDIACAKGKRRNISAAEVKFEKEKASTKKASAGSSHPHQSNVTQKSGGVTHVQQTSGLHTTGVSTSSTTVATSTATTLTTSHPDTIIMQDGRWTRFRLSICCMPAQFPDGHH